VSLRRQSGPRPRTQSSASAALADEGEFLRRSLEDLEDERARGEVDEEDYALLCARYRDRLAAVEAALSEPADGEATAESLPRAHEREGRRPLAARTRRALGRRRTRATIGIIAACCFVLAATLLAASLAGVRLPGESATGTVSLSGAQQEQETLDRAAILGSEGQVADAVQLYEEVLESDPDQPDALAYGGWLIRLAGLSSKNRLVVEKGDASVAKAVRVAPGYPDAHALLGVILYEDSGRAAAAAAQFRDALRTGGSENLLASVAPVAVKAFAAARQAIPARYASALKQAASAGG
jgi:tetratricopeptide (TPR) repeat protein